MKQTPNNNFMTSEMLEFEDIYNKTSKDIFFFSRLVGIDEKSTYQLYYSIYNKIYLSIPLPKDIEQLNDLLNKIIVKQSITILTSYNDAAIFTEEYYSAKEIYEEAEKNQDIPHHKINTYINPKFISEVITNQNVAILQKKYDPAKSFDKESEKIWGIPLNKINTYIEPEFVSKVMSALNQLPDGLRLCVALSFFKNISLECIVKYAGVPLETIKRMLYKAHEIMNKWSKAELGEDSYTPFSFLPLVLQRAEQIDSKQNPPPDLIDTCTNALNFKEHRVEQESVAEFYKDEHTLDILKGPTKSQIETAKKTGIVTVVIVGVIIIIIIALIISPYVFDEIFHYNPYGSISLQELSYESSRERVLHDRYQDPATGEYTEFSLRFIWSGDYEYSVTKDGYKLTLLKGPDILEDYAFCDCKDLSSIKLPESIKSIGKDAFEGCNSLKSIDIPSSVTEIGDTAFRSCESLQSIHLPDGLLTIGEEAFQSCRSLTQITIPKYVQDIKSNTFSDCSNLTHFTLLSSFKTFDFGIFGDFTPIKRLDLPDTIGSLESYDLFIINIDFYCRQGSKTEETLKACKAPNIYYITD